MTFSDLAGQEIKIKSTWPFEKIKNKNQVHIPLALWPNLWRERGFRFTSIIDLERERKKRYEYFLDGKVTKLNLSQ